MKENPFESPKGEADSQADDTPFEVRLQREGCSFAAGTMGCWLVVVIWIVVAWWLGFGRG